MNRGSSAATRVLIAVISIVLSLAVARAGPRPLPEPDPERGGIAVKLQMPVSSDYDEPASRVYFAPIGEDADMLAAESLVWSNHSKKGQAYRLNAKPGRYVAVAAIFDAGLLLFPKEMIPKTEVSVIRDRLAFMGAIRVDWKVPGKRKLDEAQSHYLRLIEPDVAKSGWSLGGLSRSVYGTELLDFWRGTKTEREFWTVAHEKVFKKYPSWKKQAEAQLTALGSD